MMKEYLSTTNRSVESAGLPRDYIGAIIEYIRNGYDAGATKIEINYEIDTIGAIKYLHIIDNGSGIVYENIKLSFGGFLDSPKKNRKGILMHGSKGKGRFAFQKLGNGAKRITKYQSNDGFIKQYEISISMGEKNGYEYSEPQKIEGQTGTQVIITSPTISGGHLTNTDFLEKLKKEFGWFLHLQCVKGVTLEINGVKLDYSTLFRDEPQTFNNEIKYKDKEGIEYSALFQSTIIVWKDKISDSSSYYFIDSTDNIVGDKTTSYNNKKDEFFHSVYVESEFFNNKFLNFGNNDIVGLFDTEREHKILSNYLSEISKDIENERQRFLRGNTNKIIQKFQEEGVLPFFDSDIFSTKKKYQFEEFVKEVYVITPKLFESLNEPQKKTIFSMINTLIDSEKKDDLVYIINEIENLTPEEISKLREILEISTLSSIIETIGIVQNRYKVVEGLKKLVCDLSKFTNERDHIQKIIEKNFWLVSENFTLLTADKNFKKLYDVWLETIGEKNDNGAIGDQENRRPDIFLSNYHYLNSLNPTSPKRENIIMELKRPDVEITDIQYRQIEDYMKKILSLPEHNTNSVDRKFYIIGKTLGRDVIDRLEAKQKISQEPFLVHEIKNYRIYALTRGDVFASFESRHKFVLDTLTIEYDKIQENLSNHGGGKKEVKEIVKNLI